MHSQIRGRPSTDGTIDADYTWGRPLSTYVSSLEQMRLLLFKARLQTSSATRYGL
jgi:hypothetical protein